MSDLHLLHPTAIGGDTETYPIGDRGLQAPPIVCAQWGVIDIVPPTPSVLGSAAQWVIRHAVEITRRVRDAVAWMFSREHEQIWFHNAPFDLAVILEWYPELTDLIWQALEDGRVFDTMYLQRMAQIATGVFGGPLGLDMVALQYGVRPPNKNIWTPHPTDPRFGQGLCFPEKGPGLVDVRTSFGLWDGAEEIPEPWFGYADYDGEVMLPLAARMVKRWCIPQPGQQYPVVRLEDLAQTVRTYFGLGLSRTYGLLVDQSKVGGLERVARSALGRLHEAAKLNGFLKPKFATGAQSRAQAAAGHKPEMVCPVRWESRPGDDNPKKQAAWDRRAAKHKGCPGCRVQLRDETGTPVWSKDTKAIKAAVSAAYGGKPPLTEKKKDKKTGKMKGGGQIATSRHVLQDSANEELMAWSEYNEWNTLQAKDFPIFRRGVVHTRIGIANTLRPTSSDPNVLNFRRDSFYVGECETCGYETSLDDDQIAASKKGKVLPCPICDARVQA